MASFNDWTATKLSFSTLTHGVISTGIEGSSGTQYNVTPCTAVRLSRNPIDENSDFYREYQAKFDRNNFNLGNAESIVNNNDLSTLQNIAYTKYAEIQRWCKEHNFDYIEFNKGSMLAIIPTKNNTNNVTFRFHFITSRYLSVNNRDLLLYNVGKNTYIADDTFSAHYISGGGYLRFICNPIEGDRVFKMQFWLSTESDTTVEYGSQYAFATLDGWRDMMDVGSSYPNYAIPFEDEMYKYGNGVATNFRLKYGFHRLWSYGVFYIGGTEKKAQYARSIYDVIYSVEVAENGGTYDPDVIPDGAGGWLSNVIDAAGSIIEEGLNANKSDIIQRGPLVGRGLPGNLIQFCACNDNEMRMIGNSLWTTGSLTDLFSNMKPTDYIMNIYTLPIPYEDFSVYTNKQQIYYGNKKAQFEIDGVKFDMVIGVLTQDTFIVRCGSINIPKFYDNALDYKNTKVSIYLPYCGEFELDIDRIIDGNLTCNYAVNTQTGDCLAHLYFEPNSPNLIRPEGIVGCYSGNCASPVPFGARDNSNVLRGIADTISGLATTGFGAATGNPLGIGAGVTQTVNGVMQASANTNMQIISGSVGNGTAAYYAPQKPYLIFKRANQCLPSQYGKFNGYPTEVTMNLNTCTGFTKVQSIYLNNLTCTADERAQIESLLKDGVVI